MSDVFHSIVNSFWKVRDMARCSSKDQYAPTRRSPTPGESESSDTRDVVLLVARSASANAERPGTTAPHRPSPLRLREDRAG